MAQPGGKQQVCKGLRDLREGLQAFLLCRSIVGHMIGVVPA